MRCSYARPRLLALEDRVTPASLVALTANNSLLTIDSSKPGEILQFAPVRGLAANETLTGIDSRPANGLVYGITNLQRFYQIEPATGIATQIGGQFPFGIIGVNHGLDFNPTVDRLRVVNPARQNLRLDPNTGAFADGNPGAPGTQPDTPLTFAPGDMFFQKASPFVREVAYTSNFLGATSTTLFGFDTRLNILVRIGGVNGTPSPNGGLVSTIGGLGVDVGEIGALDITSDGFAFAAVQAGPGPLNSQLALVNLTTGRLTLLGKIAQGFAIKGLAVLSRPELVYAVTASNQLTRFYANKPGIPLGTAPLTGLQAGENVVGIDFRPLTGELFGLTSTNRMLRIDIHTGQTIPVGNALDGALLTAATASGFDFNPSVDRLRLVNDANDNLRYNPVTFTAVDSDGNAGNGTQADTDLAFIATDANVGADPTVVAVAYDRNDNDGATATTLFGIDSNLNILVRQGAVDGNAADVAGGGSPNGGLLTTIGSLGVNPTSLVSFDIISRGSGGQGVAYAAMQLEGEAVSKLFTINLSTGAATLVGTLGGGELIRALAIAPPRIQFTSYLLGVSEGAGVARILVTRIGGSDETVTVQFSTSDGSATAGVDYLPVTRLLTFERGESRKEVLIPINNDASREPLERINLTLSMISGGAAQLGVQSSVALIITDNDGV